MARQDEDKLKVGLYLPEGLYGLVKEIAEAEGKSNSEMVREFIMGGLSQWVNDRAHPYYFDVLIKNRLQNEAFEEAWNYVMTYLEDTGQFDRMSQMSRMEEIKKESE